MPRRSRILTGRNSSTTPPTHPPADPGNADSDFILILVAFICAIICVLGFLAVARCTWLRRISGILPTGHLNQSLTAAANKGLNKKVLKTLPKLIYSPETITETISDCAICLSEFTSGDEIRVLPNCGHGFHVMCIDTWFGSHSSCPSCRQILIPVRCCKKCGDIPVAEVIGSRVPAAGETSG